MAMSFLPSVASLNSLDKSGDKLLLLQSELLSPELALLVVLLSRLPRTVSAREQIKVALQSEDALPITSDSDTATDSITAVSSLEGKTDC